MVLLWIIVVLVAAFVAFALGPKVRNAIRQYRKKRSQGKLFEQIQRQRAGEKRLQRRVKASPLRVTYQIEDKRLTDFRVRPTIGDKVPDDVLLQLKQYVSELAPRRFHRRLKFEYRGGQWQERKHQ